MRLSRRVVVWRKSNPGWVERKRSCRVLGKFCGQATKGAWWMPWQKQAMKDVASCDKPRGAASRL
jgi:hypothetical protein